MRRPYAEVDVFTPVPYRGNPLAVVVDGSGLSDEDMQRVANWENFSETTFLLPPTDPAADYRVRIFTPTIELPFAGHPTLGSCRVWLDNGGEPGDADAIVQECAAGLIRIRRDGARLAFAAPPLVRSGPVDNVLRARIEQVLGCDIVDAAWVDNGPGWVAALLPSADDVLAARPAFGSNRDIFLGLVGPAAPADAHDVELRAFFPGPTSMLEDPVTGSLNASVAMWLMERDPDLVRYVARQGTAVGRDGRVHVERDDDGVIWVGGGVATCVVGTIEI